jgi:arabinogalactan endo-1,4-beta-galactosidase
MGSVVNSAISAVRDATQTSTIKTKTILHIADPNNVEWWFENMTDATKGNVQDFDLMGISYYPIWHTTVGIEQISENIERFRNKFGKPVMILETAYPWTKDHGDEYNNVFGSQTPLNGYPFTRKGQYDIMVKLAREVYEGGGQGIIYWEPAWISSEMKDLWGTGSSWENCTFFDFDGNVIEGIDFMKSELK